jgi:hypothetical protein
MMSSPGKIARGAELDEGADFVPTRDETTLLRTGPARDPGDEGAMNRPSAWLKEYRRDVYSQTGEDGIVEKILETLPQNDYWCVEFGAWDGVSLSNTRNLIKHKGYSAVLIEGNAERFAELQRNCAQDTNTVAIKTFVGFENHNNLDHILGTTPIPRDFDFLSVDIDGNDYHIWQSLSLYRPKLICIEFNPTIPPEVRFVQPRHPFVSQGSSLLSLVDLGKEMSYELVSVSTYNAFFVRSEFYPLFQIESNSPETLWTDLENITYLFSGYDGTVFLRGSCRLPWHKINLTESRVQLLPRFLRSYPGSYTPFQMVGFAVYLMFRDPFRLARELRERAKHIRIRRFRV